MFTQKNFIAASRKFVCVRLESYENKETQKLMRSLLHGSFANTAFAIFAPNGKTQLSRGGRSPKQVLSQGGRPSKDSPIDSGAIIATMNQIAAKYPLTAPLDAPVIQDFDSFAQALRTASADQRLLISVNESGWGSSKLKSALSPLFGHASTIGRYHWDFLSSRTDKNWASAIKGASTQPAITVIRPGKYGLDGSVLATIPLGTSLQEVAHTITKANATFAKVEQRKVYSAHIQDGRRDRVNFSNNIPYGEDRDGDGKIDPKPSRR